MKIPLLQDKDLVLTESAAIIWYLSETDGQDHNRLIPADPREKAHCLEWCFFTLGELDETSLCVVRRHADLRQRYGEAPLAIKGASAYFEKQMRTVDRTLEAGSPCILGDRFTVADIMLSICISWAAGYGLPVSDAALAYKRAHHDTPGLPEGRRGQRPAASVRRLRALDPFGTRLRRPLAGRDAQT